MSVIYGAIHLYRSLSCLVVFFALGCRLLQAQMHVAEPPVNLGDTSFLDGVAGPGVLVEQIADVNHDGRIVGTKGATVAGQVNSTSGITHVAWLTHRKFLGAWYGVEAIGTEAYVNAGTHGEQTGLGDVTVSPLVLQWPQRLILHILVDQRAVLDFGLPSGYYNRSQAVNLGSNTFTANPYYSITAHPVQKSRSELEDSLSLELHQQCTSRGGRLCLDSSGTSNSF